MGLGYAQVRLRMPWKLGPDLSIPQIGKVRGILLMFPGEKTPNSCSQDWRIEDMATLGASPAA